MRLHNYFRSSASVRLRVALAMKGLAYDYVAHDLRTGAQRDASFLERNPEGLVPALELDDGTVPAQSLAIIEWLDETHPEPPLLPADPLGRARVRALAQSIACDLHPLANLRVLKRLEAQFDADEAARAAWIAHWVEAAFDPLETRLSRDPATGRFCHGDRPGLADICLYAQVLNNRRHGIADRWPTVSRIVAALDELPAFAEAAPARQPDAS